METFALFKLVVGQPLPVMWLRVKSVDDLQNAHPYHGEVAKSVYSKHLENKQRSKQTIMLGHSEFLKDWVFNGELGYL
jgi:phosphoenolpyruvate carboxylase